MSTGLLYQSDSLGDPGSDPELNDSSTEDAEDVILAEQENDPALQRFVRGDRDDLIDDLLLDEIEKETDRECSAPGQGGDPSQLRRSRKRKRKSTNRNARKMERTDTITGEPSKEFIAKRKNTWKVQRILRNKMRKGEDLLRNAAELDTCVIESLAYFKHTFHLPYGKGEKRGVSFFKELLERWEDAHPDRSIRYLNKFGNIAQYDSARDSWSDMLWNQPSASILDPSNLLEDDTLWVLRLLDEVNIEPYVTLLDSIKDKK